MTHDDHGRSYGRKVDRLPASNPSQGAPRRRLKIEDILPCYENGIALGTLVLTADGALPVEYLEQGDRIITRSGMRTLRNIDTPAPQMFTLIFDSAEVIFADGFQVHSKTGKTFAA
ncbi:hypothetical protein EDD53_0363 [Pacificibacter maritimus]|uniref:Hedgehog/Intein (Hint) domain-containing protein n=1 Tax=Pacificibacter maritimus TaxID=762213 RepID=A0A3N4UMK3_9RHOB|nr:hypothetical protein [Pacificibacter maritimus]RPE71248.1 hypothetical protein EDD53_0363 [Pacificibacter maritimus]